MKYYIIAGEASGDLHGSNLIKAIIRLDPAAEFRFWGGHLMEAACATSPVKHYREMAFMGFVEVVKHLPTIWGFFTKAKKDIADWEPDRVVLIDYPGFNLRMAKWLSARHYHTTYYITPQVWAWHESRVRQIGSDTDIRLVILPFEADFFAARGVDSHYVGHPLMDAVDSWTPDPAFRVNNGLGKSIIALLPGSRTQEISRLLPVMLDAVSDRLDDYDVVIAQSPSKDAALYTDIIGSRNVRLISDSTYDILHVAKIAVVASGTATLETAIHDVPQVVCYIGGAINYAIGSRLVKLEYISLVNLILDAPVVKELIQNDCTPAAIADEVQKLLDPIQAAKIKLQYKQLRALLGKGASQQAAAYITDTHDATT